MELIGWLGGFFLTICGAPLAWRSYKDGHAKGVDMLFLQLWLWGEVLVLVYVLAQPTILIPLAANYAFNIALILVILKYKFIPCKDQR